MILPSIGIDGQKVLSTSSVLVVGAGGIGSTVLLYLAGLTIHSNLNMHISTIRLAIVFFLRPFTDAWTATSLLISSF